MDKFYVYVFSAEKSVQRLYVNEVDVKALYQTKDGIQVVRSITNQIAVPVGDIILWKDIEDATLSGASK
jgi:hypothetical protein